RAGEIGIVRCGDICHPTAELQPARQCEHEMTLRVERTEIERDTVRFGQTAQLRGAEFARRDEFPVNCLEKGGDVATRVVSGFAKRMLLAERHDFRPRKWFAGTEFA